jgi:hypothetical protein
VRLDLLLYSLIFINEFWNQKLKIPSKFNFRLNFSDFYRNSFAMSLKFKILFMVFFTDFHIVYLVKSFFKGHVLNKKIQFLR